MLSTAKACIGLIYHATHYAMQSMALWYHKQGYLDAKHTACEVFVLLSTKSTKATFYLLVSWSLLLIFYKLGYLPG